MRQVNAANMFSPDGASPGADLTRGHVSTDAASTGNAAHERISPCLSLSSCCASLGMRPRALICSPAANLPQPLRDAIAVGSRLYRPESWRPQSGHAHRAQQYCRRTVHVISRTQTC